MSKIDEMIRELCPNGVSYVKVETICSSTMGEFVRKDKQNPNGKYPVYNGGSTNTGWYDEYNTDANKIIISARGAAGFVNKVDIPFWAGNSCHVLKIKDSSIINYHYLYYALKQSEKFLMDNQQKGGGVPAVSKKQVENLEIPLPPHPIQQKIVYVLDSFTTLIDKMKQEVEKRKKQMEYYCDQYYGGDIEGMMALANDSNNSIITFAELGTITRGKRFVRDDVRESGQPCIHYGDMYTYYGTKSYQANTFLDRDFPKKMRYAKKGDVVIVGAGENDYDIGVGVVWMGDEPAAVHDACYILEHNQNPMYISYYLRSNIYHQQLKKHVSSGKISSFSAEGLGKVYIPIQPIEKQNEIVSILDKFESYISKLEKMIMLRQKQYEYYREQLLTFE